MDYRRDIGLGWLQANEDPDWLSLSDWSQAVGNVLGLAGTGMDWFSENVPQRALGEAVGGLSQPNARAMLPAYMQPLADAVNRPDVRDVYKKQGPQAAWRLVKEKYLPGGEVGGFLAETAVDPTNLLGWGLAAKGAKAAAKLGPAAKPLVAGLRGLDVADKAITAATTAPLKAAGAALKKAPWAFDLSKQGKLSRFEDALKDATNEARGLGYKYKGIEVGNAVGAYPGSPVAVTKAENAAWNALENDMEKLKDPAAQFRALQAKEYAKRNADKWGAEAEGEAARLRAQGGPAVQQEINEIWQTRHRKVMQVAKGLQDEIGKYHAEVVAPGPHPFQAQAQTIIQNLNSDITTLTSATRGNIDNAKRTMAPGDFIRERDRQYRLRDSQIGAYIQDAQQKLQSLYGGQIPDTEALTGLKGRVAELESMYGGLPSFFGKMSTERAGTLQGLMPSVDKYAAYVDRDRNRLQKLLDGIARRNPGFTPDASSSEALLGQLDSVGLPTVQPGESNEIRTLLDRWRQEGQDLLGGDALDLVTHKISMDERKRLGITGFAPWVKPLITASQAWKEQALVSPRFHLQNAISILAMSGLSGIPVNRVVRNLLDSMALLGQRKGVQSPSMVRQAADQWEMRDLPRTVQAGSGLIQDLMGSAGQVLMHGESNIATSHIPLVGKPLGRVVEGNKLLAGSIEHAARSTAWLTGKEKYLRSQLPTFYRDLEGMLTAPRSAVMTPRPANVPADAYFAARQQGGATAQAVVAQQSQIQAATEAAWRQQMQGELARKAGQPVTAQGVAPFTQQQAQQIVNSIRSFGDKMGPTKLSEALAQRGVDVDTINRVTQRWSNALQQGDVAGEKLASKINFDYSKTDNLEEMLRYVMPFIIWPKRAIPYFAEALAEHPGFIMALDRYRDASEDETGALSPRFKGMVSSGDLGAEIARRIFGVKGKLMASPLDVVMPFADVSAPESANTPAEFARQLMSGTGASLAPWVDIPLTLAGVFGDKPYPDMLRHSNILQSVGGPDIEAPWQEMAGNLQTQLTGKKAASPQGWTDYLVRKRIQEMSMEDIGKARDPKYMAAVNDVQSPIYKRALADVNLERGRQSGLGFVSPLYTRPLRETEEGAARAEAALLRPVRNAEGEIVAGGKVGGFAGADYEATQARNAVMPEEAKTYGTPPPLESAKHLFTRAGGWKLSSAQWRDSYMRRKGNDMLKQYLYWLKDKGYDIEKGDIGTMELVNQFLSERGQ